MASSTMLGSISDMVPQFANIIAKTVDSDVLVVDNNFVIIGETNRYFMHKHYVTGNTMIGQVIVNQKKIIIPNKDEYPICQACKDHDHCQIVGFIGIPIVYDNAIIGAIALFLPKHRIDNIFQDVDSSIAFVENMAEDLVFKIQKKKEYNDLNQVIKDRELILDVLPEAIVYADNQGVIRFYNKAFEVLFQVKNMIIGDQIQEVIPHKVIYEFLDNRRQVLNQKILIELGSVSFYGFVSCNTAQYNGMKNGTVFVFKTIIDAVQNARAAEKGSIVTLQYLKNWLIPNDVLDRAKALAVTNEMVLIKSKSRNLNEILAKGICNYSGRSLQGLSIIYCDGIYREFLERYIFDEFGEIQRSDHGTIFFKNIEHTPMYLQKKLLEFLKYRDSNRQINPMKSDVRFLFSTVENLMELVKKGLFMEELYYIISENVIEIPSLNKDINLLKSMILGGLDFYKKKHSKEDVTLTEEAVQFLCTRSWHENTADIEALLEQIVLRNKDDVTVDDIVSMGMLQTEKEKALISINDLEKEKIRELLNKGNNKTKIAQLLGISRATLYRKLEEYDL